MSHSGFFVSRPRRSILFVAADEDALWAYHATARSEGFESELARDGLEALLLASLAHPDVVVLDLRRPELHGAWIVRRLRAATETRALPIVLVGMAGEAGRNYERRPYALDSEAHLRLFGVIQRLLNPLVRSRSAQGRPA
jgi:CheY-like chemotaxis protein